MAVQTIYVDVEEEIPELIERLKLSSSTDIPVVVPARSKLAQSRFNFQLLGDYARRLDKSIAIISGDPAVRHMAADNGFSTFAAVEEYSDRDLIGSAVAASMAAGATTAVAAPGARVAAPVRPPPERERPARPPRIKVRPGATVGELRSRTGGLLLAALATLAVIAILVGAAVFVPSARITLVAQATDFSHSTDIQAAPNSAPVRIRLVSQNKQASRNFPSTGTQTKPAEPGRGGVVYTNTCPQFRSLVLIDATRLFTPGGVEFFQVGDVTVAKGTPTAAGVIAVNRGAAGNVPAGAITIIKDAGSLSACLTVTNPSPISGGTDEQKLVFVSQGDVDAARAQLDSDLRALVQDEMAKAVQPGEKLADTVDFKLDFFADHKAGDGVASFSATATQTGSGAAYNADDVRKALIADLQKTVPKDQALTDNQIATDFHVASSSADGHMAFHGTAKGFVAPRIDFAKVRARLSAQNTLTARSYLRTLPVQSVDIHQEPFQLPILPVLGTRIDIRYEVQAGKAVTRP